MMTRSAIRAWPRHPLKPMEQSNWLSNRKAGWFVCYSVCVLAGLSYWFIICQNWTCLYYHGTRITPIKRMTADLFLINRSVVICPICVIRVPWQYYGSLFLSFKPPENNEIDNNPLFWLFFYFVRNLDRFWIDSFHGFNPFGWQQRKWGAEPISKSIQFDCWKPETTAKW